MRTKYPDLETTTERRCPAGHPQVVRCHPVRASGSRPAPFPTLFWLRCPVLVRQLSRLEAAGWIRLLQAEIARDAALARRVEEDHLAYREERWTLVRPAEEALLRAHGMTAALRNTGIGGAALGAPAKCLHLHYAHHLARGSAVGEWLERRAGLIPCGAGEAS